MFVYFGVVLGLVRIWKPAAVGVLRGFGNFVFSIWVCDFSGILWFNFGFELGILLAARFCAISVQKGFAVDEPRRRI